MSDTPEPEVEVLEAPDNGDNDRVLDLPEFDDPEVVLNEDGSTASEPEDEPEDTSVDDLTADVEVAGEHEADAPDDIDYEAEAAKGLEDIASFLAEAAEEPRGDGPMKGVKPAINASQAKTILNRLGFRTNTAARYKQSVRDFQGFWALGTALKVDGLVGPLTAQALLWSERNRKAGRGTLSTNFSFSEFRCKCGGVYGSCRRIAGEGVKGSGKHVGRALVSSLEVYRKTVGGFVPVSGYRCDSYNARIGGARGSLHRIGAACDTPQEISHQRVAAMHRFGGIGYMRSTGRVAHVDRRDLVPGWNNGGSLRNPMTWIYG